MRHVAGPPERDELEGVVQRCLRCDAVLLRLDPGRGRSSGAGLRVGAQIAGACPGTPDALAEALAGRLAAASS